MKKVGERMKALFIVGSPREHGCTSLMVDKIIEGMSGSGIDVTKHVLGKMKINYCLGCKTCQSSRQCVQSDDMDILINDLFTSDIVLIAAPSYWGDVPGQLKVFFDRSTPLCDTNEGGTSLPKGKKGYSVALRAGSRVDENQHLINAIEHYYGHLGIEPVDHWTFESINEVNDVLDNPDVLKKAFEGGRKIVAF